FLYFQLDVDRADLHSFPTRRSSDLKDLLELLLRGESDMAKNTASEKWIWQLALDIAGNDNDWRARPLSCRRASHNSAHWLIPAGDRKSTRLNSSHVKISYAVFCLKK